MAGRADITLGTERLAAVWLGSIIEHYAIVMQAAWLEWQHGAGAEAAMGWIANTLKGPDLIPDINETGTDAQAFFDRTIAESRERQREAEANL